MNYDMYPADFKGKDEPDEHEYKAVIEVETSVMATSVEDAKEQIEEDFRGKFDNYYIQIQ